MSMSCAALLRVQGQEPQYEPPADLLPEVELVLPEEQMMPVWDAAPCVPPKWVPPCEPRPVGFLRGCGPVLVFDVSGTMHPARQGQFLRMRQCVAELLHPQGGPGVADGVRMGARLQLALNPGGAIKHAG